MIKKIFLFFLIVNYNFLEAKPTNKKIVFMGNSITQMWSDNSFFFKSNPSFINKGISGQTTPQMLIRFNDDVIKENANTVIILAGINDIAQNTGPIQIKDIADNIFRMAEMAQKNNINVFICSVLPANRILWNKSIKPTYKVIKLNILLKEFCKNKNIEYVDYYSEMVDWSGGLKSPLSTSKWALVHPNKKGYEKMEEILIKKIKKEL